VTSLMTVEALMVFYPAAGEVFHQNGSIAIINR
jgi:hypothetical protein